MRGPGGNVDDWFGRSVVIRCRALGAVLAGVLVFAGCGVAADGVAAGEPGSGAGNGDIPEELGFTARTVSGDTFSGTSLAGKDAVLWFWAPWCMVCRGEAPGMAQVAEKYGERVAELAGS